MSFLSDYLSKNSIKCKMRRLHGLLVHECEPTKDTSAEILPQLRQELQEIDGCFLGCSPQVVSGDSVERNRSKKFGRIQHKTMDAYIFTGDDGDPIYLAECKYRKSLPHEPSKLEKEDDFFCDVMHKLRISDFFLRHQGRVIARGPAYIVCSEPVAAPLYADYVDYCDQKGVRPALKIVDTVGLKECLKDIV